MVVAQDVAPPGWVDAPLELTISREVDAARYGGVSLYATAAIWSREVADVLNAMPPGCLDQLGEEAVEDGTAEPLLAHIDLDSLRASDWTAIGEADVEAEAARFFEVVEEPLRRWAAARQSPRRLIELQGAPGAAAAHQSELVRTMAVLSVQQGLVDEARRLVAEYVPAVPDTEERFTRFEVELARRFPEYGSTTRS